MAAELTSQVRPFLGHDICFHTWEPCNNHRKEADGEHNNDDDIAGLVIIFHGFLAHGLYPTVRTAAEALSASSLSSSDSGTGRRRPWMVMSMDLPGHGQSSGLRGYLPPPEDLIETAYQLALEAQRLFLEKHFTINNNENNRNNYPSLLLLGSSLGGALACAVAKRLAMAPTSESSPQVLLPLKGLIMLAPMIRLPISPVEQGLLRGLSWVLPSTWALIPTSVSDGARQYRDPLRRQACIEDPLCINATSLRLGSAMTLWGLTQWIQQHASHWDDSGLSILLLLADQDVIVDNQGALDWWNRIQPTTKESCHFTLKRYPALHGLLCEPSPLVDEIVNDLLTWARARGDQTA